MSPKKNKVLLLNPQDNVVIALVTLTPSENVIVEGVHIQVVDTIPKGHKMARLSIGSGLPVVKYGDQIGLSKMKIDVGQHVHVHNLMDVTTQVSMRERKKLSL
jgi:hypothetical protein